MKGLALQTNIKGIHDKGTNYNAAGRGAVAVQSHIKEQPPSLAIKNGKPQSFLCGLASLYAHLLAV